METYSSLNLVHNNNNNNNEKQRKKMVRKEFKTRLKKEDKFGMPIPNSATQGMYLVVPNRVNFNDRGKPKYNNDVRERFYTHVNLTGNARLPIGSPISIGQGLRTFLSDGFHIYLHPLGVFLKSSGKHFSNGLMTIMNSKSGRNITVVPIGNGRWSTIRSTVIKKKGRNQLKNQRLAQVLNARGAMTFNNARTWLGLGLVGGNNSASKVKGNISKIK